MEITDLRSALSARSKVKSKQRNCSLLTHKNAIGLNGLNTLPLMASQQLPRPQRISVIAGQLTNKFYSIYFPPSL